MKFIIDVELDSFRYFLLGRNYKVSVKRIGVEGRITFDETLIM
ncbi:hypothetical protein GCM10008910_39970 [Faecalicatena orotica]